MRLFPIIITYCTWIFCVESQAAQVAQETPLTEEQQKRFLTLIKDEGKALTVKLPHTYKRHLEENYFTDNAQIGSLEGEPIDKCEDSQCDNHHCQKGLTQYRDERTYDYNTSELSVYVSGPQKETIVYKSCKFSDKFAFAPFSNYIGARITGIDLYRAYDATTNKLLGETYYFLSATDFQSFHDQLDYLKVDQLLQRLRDGSATPGEIAEWDLYDTGQWAKQLKEIKKNLEKGLPISAIKMDTHCVSYANRYVSEVKTNEKTVAITISTRNFVKHADLNPYRLLVINQGLFSLSRIKTQFTPKGFQIGLPTAQWKSNEYVNAYFTLPNAAVLAFIEGRNYDNVMVRSTSSS